MIRPVLITFAMALSLGACVAAPQTTFIPSKKSPIELRVMQTRVLPGDDNTTMRDVIATLHGLGYRITRAEADAGTVSGTRFASLRMAVVVRPGAGRQSIVRANATILDVGREAQVDSAEFYQQNFFVPLAVTAGRSFGDLTEGDMVPEAVRPVAEINTADQRKAAANAAATKSPPKP